MDSPFLSPQYPERRNVRAGLRVRQSQRTAAIALLLAASLVLNTVGLWWGLPNGNRTWAADALQPLTPLAVGRHVWFGERWNSGWFYFKYPVGHPNLLLAAQAPVLAWMRLTGELGRPQAEYPHGFRNPERSLAILAGVTRLVSALMGTAAVLLAYGTFAIYLAPAAAWAGAAVFAGSAPFVFYSHTSNVDVPLLFWLLLALWAVLRGARERAGWPSLLAGAAAAMALLTKEQGIGFLVALPAIWLLERTRTLGLGRSDLVRHAGLACIAFIVTTACVANVFWNPAGYVNRWRFLMGTLPEEVRQRYAPYQFFTQVPKKFAWDMEAKKIARAGESVARSLPPAGGWLALVGGLTLLAYRPRLALVALVLASAYYAFSLRALELIPIRYTLPLLWVAAVALGVLVSAIGSMVPLRKFPPWLKGSVVALWLVWSWAPGAEVVRLLLQDPRYEAENWFRAQGEGVKRAEVYQPDTYLPRFPRQWLVQRPPVKERTIDGLRARNPDFIVLSSGGKAGWVGQYARSWQPGQQIFTESPAAREFFRALRAGELDYGLGPVFARSTWLDHRIHSLNPTIEVYTRRQTR